MWKIQIKGDRFILFVNKEWHNPYYNRKKESSLPLAFVRKLEKGYRGVNWKSGLTSGYFAKGHKVNIASGKVEQSSIILN